MGSISCSCSICRFSVVSSVFVGCWLEALVWYPCGIEESSVNGFRSRGLEGIDFSKYRSFDSQGNVLNSISLNFRLSDGRYHIEIAEQLGSHFCYVFSYNYYPTASKSSIFLFCCLFVVEVGIGSCIFRNICSDQLFFLVFP